MKSLDEILQEYFNCNKPFLKKRKLIPTIDGERYEYLTQSGARAYGKLTDLLYDLAALGVISLSVANDAVEELDSIVRSDW